MLPADYYSSVNRDLLRLIPPDAGTVLEIGCGEGALCEAYRRINPGVDWRGVEVNEKAAAIARKILNHVWDEDIEEVGYLVGTKPTLPNYAPKADCLVIGDVLEHLHDPWEVLLTLADNLKPGAQVLACIPNVQHWTVIRDLLEGKWEYTDSGLLDRTHLRFFTLDSIRKLFADAGLHVFEILGRDIGNEGFDDWLNTTDLHDKPEMLAYQYVVRAIKPSASIEPIPKLHIHAVTAEECCARPRIHEPFAMLRTVPGVTSTAGPILGDRNADIQIWQRSRIDPQLIIDDVRASMDRQIFIAEIDDDPTSPMYLHGQPFDPLPLQAVHAVQCSTEAIAEIVRQYNPNVAVFPNQLASLPPWREREPRESVHIFFGAQNRESDWAPIMPALNRIIDEHHSKLWFSVVHDRKFYNALDTMHKSFSPFCEYEKYRQLLGACDIALLPLEDTPFNQCKSDIKFLECAAEGVVVLASETVYRQVATTHNGTLASYGILYRCPDTFESALRILIKDASLRQGISTNAYAYARDNRLLGQHYRARLEWYQSLIHSKPVLDRSLRDRVPGLIARPVTA